MVTIWSIIAMEWHLTTAMSSEQALTRSSFLSVLSSLGTHLAVFFLGPDLHEESCEWCKDTLWGAARDSIVKHRSSLTAQPQKDQGGSQHCPFRIQVALIRRAFTSLYHLYNVIISRFLKGLVPKASVYCFFYFFIAFADSSVPSDEIMCPCHGASGEG
jgi:hypothetical protein